VTLVQHSHPRTGPRAGLPTDIEPADPEANLSALLELIDATPVDPEYLLPLLIKVQARFGYISQPAIRTIAHAFNLSRADVYGVVTFYHDLREEPVGQTVIQLCMAEACQSVGCRELAAHASNRLRVPLGATTADGRIHLEAAYCFGNCALGPTVRIGDRIHGGVSPQRFDELLGVIPQAPL
jgi:formate dehydrogenase subunit gamma